MTTIQPLAIAPLRELSALQPPSATRIGPAIDPKKILVVAKRTRIERDMQRFNASFEDVIKEYQEVGEDVTEVVASHHEQLRSKAQITALLTPTQVRYRDQVTDAELNSASLVIALGGDGHFQSTAHRIHSDTPLLGVSSDRRSYGALLSCRIEEFEEFLHRLQHGDYQLCPWITLSVEVNGKKLPPALCDVLLAERERSEMSRHFLAVRDAQGKPLYSTEGKGVSQKSSGLLVATGAGANNRAWSRAASRFVFPKGLTFPRSARKAAFILTEASNTHPGITEESDELPPLTAGDLVDGETMIITSLNDSEGVVLVDSQERLSFPRGATARIKLSDHVQWVVTR